MADLGGRFEATIELGPAQRKRGVSVTADYRLWAFKGWTGDVLTASP
ncbi:MAG: hypothetical protein HKP01_09325 [Gemmatimonadetes bacterium]|nr:hypothetical protein [Gemmatimonadota bacterium]